MPYMHTDDPNEFADWAKEKIWDYADRLPQKFEKEVACDSCGFKTMIFCGNFTFYWNKFPIYLL